ncbi:MAG: AraC family transcriptional regulator [Prevotella salivae]|jgi:transcriptional regulator, araC family|uniref:Transcriptional regulator, AraC family n=1 Tax=Segatella salivae DSM 15606 TaxID=888832 RepID=E6MSR1_9BACT|nr:helix-turn-helix domain-containing protein [Segatella salivae]EFV03333.1 transcriptional regulator, AraC family [Segatella salivae DSM 15606]MBF1533256.1 AraC family transcriptional regulator [Segatella salivae]MBF1536687.1 AraC family transcriptional regulator [Segatella salivae]MBF1541246.1 AraC family transcriptional regulator [Segatella salivae]MBF1546467.1 AraC family transcriptional regulator [Segatella salivae]
MDYRETIITGSDFTKMGAAETKDYIAHVLCLQGSCSFVYNGERYDLLANNLLIVRQHHLIKDFSPHENFDVMVLFIHAPFMDSAAPDVNFGVRSTLLLMENPILKLTKEEAIKCKKDLDAIVERAKDRDHSYYLDALAVSCLQLFLDVFDFENRIYGPTHVPLRSARLIRDFIKLLQNGEYKSHREVAYYAGKLFVTAKYLSDVCRTVTGHPANYWIHHFVNIDIRLHLRNRRLSVLEISEKFNFSSPAHFTRYVQAQLGESPSAIRER